MADAETLFVDTHVLVYANVVEAPLHHAALQAIQAYEKAGQVLWISRQVLREYLATLTRPWQFPTPPSIATLMTQVRHFTARFRMPGRSRPVPNWPPPSSCTAPWR